MSRSLTRPLLALAALLLSLTAAELGVRLLAPQPPASEPGLKRGAFTVPGEHRHTSDEFDVTVHVNAHGFVDHEWGPRQPGLPRVLLLGDSFVQGAQVELEEGLGRQLDLLLPQAEVLSLGVPGAGPATALLLLQDLGPELQPDLVVWAMLSSNDVLNSSPVLDGKRDKPWFELVGGELRRSEGQARGPVPLADWSHLVRWVARTFEERAAADRKLEAGGGLPVDLRVHDPAGGAEWEMAWAVTEALVAALAREAEDQGAGFGVLVLPDQVVATVEGRAEAVERWPQLAGWDLLAAHQRAVALCAERAPTLDLLPALQHAEGGLYFRRDGHWTARGHAVAAEAAAPAIRDWLSSTE